MGVIGILWLLSLWHTAARARNDTQPISIFRSRPDLVSPILNIIERQAELQAPGYYFIAPYQQIQESVHIYDNDANLIWSGFGAAGPGISHAPQVCQYQGEPHLCFYQGTQMIGWGHGHGIIMDKHYRIVKSVEPGSYQASSDMHEFQLINDGKSALMSQFLRSVHDLCPWNLCDGLGYIQQGAFQEVDVETGKVLFEWRSLDHVDPDESYVLPGTTEISGSGERPQSPWDYFHINSIDKNDDGDYLISARHVSALYKISGKDGHVIWRLNGAKSDYYMDGVQFSFQHDARFISDNKDETVLSVFDNGSNGFNQTQPFSAGIIIKLDHKTKIATAVQTIESPELDGGRQMSKSQGNFQRLPGGNIILGWGNNAFWTEYTSDGEVVFYGSIGIENVMNYRVHKFDNWIGLPLTKPAVWTYSKYGNSNTKMRTYISWNGATEVKQWKLYVSNSRNGPWTVKAIVPKDGFETIYQSDDTTQYTYVEALDANMRLLSTSEVQQTFVPNKIMLEYCDDLACQFMPSPQERERLRKEKEEQEHPPTPPKESKGMSKEEKIRNAKIYGGTLGGLAVVILLLVVFSTRNFVSRPINTVWQRIWHIIRRHSKRSPGAHYQALDLNDRDEARAPMIKDGS